MKIPDVLGCFVDDAVEALESKGYRVSIIESYGKRTIEDGKPRVLRQQEIKDGVIELIISFF